MSKNTIQSLLSVLAVASILVGASTLSQAVIAFVKFRQAIAGLGVIPNSLPMERMDTAGLVSAAMPVLWGLLLYRLVPTIAVHIHRRQDAA